MSGILSSNISKRITCVNLRQMICQVHPHYDPIIVMTFTLDGVKKVWVENDDGEYNVKVKDDEGNEKTWVGLSQRDAINIIEAQ